MKVLVTGISGFAGTYLVEHLIDQGYEVYGSVQSSRNWEFKNQVETFEGDLIDQKFVAKLIKKTDADFVFHLAAYTSPAQSVNQAFVTLTNNIGITVNLLEELKNSRAKVLLIGSVDEYGIVESGENPVRETNSMRPTNPYAVSKITQDYLGLQYFLSQKMKIVRVRPGNHTGPGQRPDFVIPAFARQIALIENGKQEPTIKVGNLEAERDFTDVRDIVQGYHLAVLKGKPGEVYNLGSGKSVKIRKILDSLISLSEVKVRIDIDLSKKRSIDIPKIEIDSSKFRQLTGWKPKIKLDQTLNDVLNYWRNNV